MDTPTNGQLTRTTCSMRGVAIARHVHNHSGCCMTRLNDQYITYPGRRHYLCFLCSWLYSLICALLIDRRKRLASRGVMFSGPFIANSAPVNTSSSCNATSCQHRWTRTHGRTRRKLRNKALPSAHTHQDFEQPGWVLPIRLIHWVPAICSQQCVSK